MAKREGEIPPLLGTERETETEETGIETETAETVEIGRETETEGTGIVVTGIVGIGGDRDRDRDRGDRRDRKKSEWDDDTKSKSRWDDESSSPHCQRGRLCCRHSREQVGGRVSYPCKAKEESMG